MRLRAAVVSARGGGDAGGATGTGAGETGPRTPRTLVGGIGYRFQRDASFGLAVSDALADLEWPHGVAVADLGYGALHVADDLRSAEPPWERVIFVAGVVRDREPGTVVRRHWSPQPLDPEDTQTRLREAGAGVIDLDHLLVLAQHFGGLPSDVLLYELEPLDVDGGEGLSATAEARLDEVVRRVRADALGGPWARAGADDQAQGSVPAQPTPSPLEVG